MRRMVVRGIGAMCALIITCSVAALPTHAQATDPEALKQSRKILELTNALAMGEQMLAMMLPQVTDLIAKANPSKELVVRKLIDQYFEPSLRESLPELLDECAIVYARHFTVDELNELVAFYATPLGQKLIESQSQLMVELNQVGQVWGMAAARRALQKLTPILKERGLEVPA